MARTRKAEFVTWMGPLLDALRSLGDSATPHEAADRIAVDCSVPDAKREELMASGTSRFHNQVCWARQYLFWEGLVGSGGRGIWTLTAKGKTAHLSLEESHAIFRKWVGIHAAQRKQKELVENVELEDNGEVTDDELLEEGDSQLAETKDLLEILQSMTPNGFERFTKYLLRVYGFERVEVTPIGKDGGIDGFGILQLNPFVSFKVIFQCKRYKGTVSRAQVGDLRNAMIGRADKGIMITTGIFSEDAKREATREGAPAIELVDGNELVRMLERERIGVSPKTVYEVDHEFFEPYLSDR